MEQSIDKRRSMKISLTNLFFKIFMIFSQNLWRQAGAGRRRPALTPKHCHCSKFCEKIINFLKKGCVSEIFIEIKSIYCNDLVKNFKKDMWKWNFHRNKPNLIWFSLQVLFKKFFLKLARNSQNTYTTCHLCSDFSDLYYRWRVSDFIIHATFH